MATAVLPPGYSALRECLKGLAPDLASSSLGANAFITTGAPLYAAWAPQAQAASTDDPWGGGASTTAYDPVKAFNDVIDYIPEVDYVYRPSAMRVTDAYGLILSSLEFSTVGKAKGLDKLYAAQTELAKTIAGLRSDMWKGYVASPQYPTTPFQSYLIADPLFQQYQERIQELSGVTLQIRQKLGPGGAVANAVTEYNALINPATAPSVINPWRWGDVDVPGLIQNWRRGSGLNPERVERASTASDSSTSTYIDGGGKDRGGFVDLFAAKDSNKQSQETSINNSSEQIGMVLQVKAWAMVPVVVNDVGTGNKSWYSASILRAYNQDPYFEAPFTGATKGAHPAYGPTGIYPWRISGVIIAFQPTVTIQMGEKSYAEWQKVTQTKKRWSAGPFGIFGSGSSTSQSSQHTVHTDEQKQTITLEDTNQNPVILGMTMENVP